MEREQITKWRPALSLIQCEQGKIAYVEWLHLEACRLARTGDWSNLSIEEKYLGKEHWRALFGVYLGSVK